MKQSLLRDGIVGVFALVSVVIVLIVAGGVVPRHVPPHAPDTVIAAIPHINVLLSLLAVLTIIYGWRAVRLGRIRTHRRAMISAMGLFVLFLVLYLYRLTILGGPTGFDGSVLIYQFLYLPILILHIGLAIICIPLLYDTLALGLTVPTQELPATRHPAVGRVAASLWVVSFCLGIGVYLLLYHI